MLKTLADQTLGVISNACGVRFEINLADLSTIEFTVPYMVDGVVTPLYDQIVGYKVVWTEAYGIYVLTRPQITGDGVKEVKQVTGYSLEYLRENYAREITAGKEATLSGRGLVQILEYTWRATEHHLGAHCRNVPRLGCVLHRHKAN